MTRRHVFLLSGLLSCGCCQGITGLTEGLVSADAVAEAVRAHHEEMNHENHARRAQAEADRTALAKIERAIAGIMAAIEDDMYEPTMKARMEELQQQKAEIEARLSDYPSRLPAGRWHGNPKSGKSSRDFALSIDVGAQPATNGWVSAPSSPANRAAPLAISEAPRTVVNLPRDICHLGQCLRQLTFSWQAVMLGVGFSSVVTWDGVAGQDHRTQGGNA